MRLKNLQKPSCPYSYGSEVDQRERGTEKIHEGMGESECRSMISFSISIFVIIWH